MSCEIRGFTAPGSAQPSSELLPQLTAFKDRLPEPLRPIGLLVLAQFLSLNQRQPFNLNFSTPPRFRDAAARHNRGIITLLYTELARVFDQCPVMQKPKFRYQAIGFV